MIWAILGGVICAFVLGAVIAYKVGYEDGIRSVYDHRERKAVK